MKNSRTASMKDVRVLTIMAMLAALSIIFGKYLAFNAGPFRISFENLSILMAGMFLGAPAGCLTGILADVIGSLMVGYTINPIITLGAGAIGLISGLLFRSLPTFHVSRLPDGMLRNLAVVLTAHLCGSMVIKSIGLMAFYQYTIPQVALRVPLYLVIGTAETLIITALLSNKAFAAEIERLGRK